VSKRRFTPFPADGSRTLCDETQISESTHGADDGDCAVSFENLYISIFILAVVIGSYDALVRG
jgi:hypothetical protein